ncbi:MAG: hypothetical protein AAF518_24295, partial [Spirochaetota bacterium]
SSWFSEKRMQKKYSLALSCKQYEKNRCNTMQKNLETSDKHTVVNVIRIVIISIATYISLQNEYRFFRYACVACTSFSIFWLFFTELWYGMEMQHPNLSYIPTSIDVAIISI